MTETLDLPQKLAELQQMTLNELRAEYLRVYGDSANTNNRVWLVKKIVWRIQALAYGGLSERAKKRAEELANEADLRMNPPKPKGEEQGGDTVLLPSRDPRLPSPGTILTRDYKGQTIQVKVLEQGAEYAGQVFKSLTAVARHITGTHTNGYLFFNLGGKS